MHTNPRLAWRNPSGSTPRPLVPRLMKTFKNVSLHLFMCFLSWQFVIAIICLAALALALLAVMCVLWPIVYPFAYTWSERRDKQKA